MAAQTLDSQDLTVEVEKLRRRCKRLEGAVLMMLALTGAGVLLAAVQADKPTIEAQEFVLRDTTGKVAARLGQVQQGLFTGTGLELYDGSPKVRATLAVSEHGPVLLLNDPAGRQTVSLGNWADGPALSLYGKNEKKLVWLGVSRQLIPLLSLQDAAETTRAEVAVNDEQGPLLTFYDSKGGLVYRKP